MHAEKEECVQVTIYTDGSSKGNPGPGGYGVVLIYIDPQGAEHRKELSGGYLRTTNNRMELMGAIVALEALTRPCEVELHSDSRYLVDAFNQHWVEGWVGRGWKTSTKKPVKNPDLWSRLLTAMAPHKVSFFWVKGHASSKLNERCDELAKSAADGKRENLLKDEGFVD